MSVSTTVFTPTAEEARPLWRRLGNDLWAGRRGSTSLGTIEAHRRFVWVDADGTPRGRYPTLLDAQRAAEASDCTENGRNSTPSLR